MQGFPFSVDVGGGSYFAVVWCLIFFFKVKLKLILCQRALGKFIVMLPVGQEYCFFERAVPHPGLGLDLSLHRLGLRAQIFHGLGLRGGFEIIILHF